VVVSDAKHTPGPFFSRPRSDGIAGNVICPADDPSALAVAIVPFNLRHRCEVEANTALFAAAPEMLAALQEISRNDDIPDHVLEPVRTAIAKATEAA
jgi:hypothetical protein